MNRPKCKTLLTVAVIASLAVPIFRSGGRTHLTFWQWVVNHTIFGPPVEYVPEEDYQAELEVFIHKEVIGGTPASAGYQWDPERQGWVRGWDPESFTPRDEIPEWDQYIPILGHPYMDYASVNV